MLQTPPEEEQSPFQNTPTDIELEQSYHRDESMMVEAPPNVVSEVITPNITNDIDFQEPSQNQMEYERMNPQTPDVIPVY